MYVCKNVTGQKKSMRNKEFIACLYCSTFICTYNYFTATDRSNLIEASADVRSCLRNFHQRVKEFLRGWGSTFDFFLDFLILLEMFYCRCVRFLFDKLASQSETWHSFYKHIIMDK